VTTIAVVVVGAILPVTPVGRALGFAPLPPAYFAFLAAVAATYLVLVEVVKRALSRSVLRK
jgi:Mg2+-importing ATPase